MPELPEVETVRRGLLPILEGRRIEAVELRRPDLRFPFPAGFVTQVRGATVSALRRRAKYLIADLDTAQALIMHLGMTGSFRIEEDAVAGAAMQPARRNGAPHDHVVFSLRNGRRLIYNDPRRFGFMTLAPLESWHEHPLFARLGLEPTGNEFSAAALADRIEGRKAPLKAILTDQRIIAGLGNIYASEALWRARLSPERAGGTLVRTDGKPRAPLERLTASVREMIAEAIAAGGSSIRDYVRADGSLGNFQHRFSVYGREHQPCLRARCRGTIRRTVQAGRSTFHCPVCQK